MFNIIKCVKPKDTIKLDKQLSFRSHSCLLPSKSGKCIYTIQVLEGKMRINHSSYNPDGGTWSCPPSGGRQMQFYDLSAGDIKTIEIIIESHFDQLDRVEVVNCSMRKLLSFTYSVIYEL